MKALLKLTSVALLIVTAFTGAISACSAQDSTNLPAMQRPVTVSLWSQPLHTALSKISAATGVHLMAAPDLMHYRISVAVHDQPLLNVINEIVDLFGHGTIPYHDYGWAHVTKPDGYFLERNGEAIQQEQDMLKYPAMEMAHQLKEIARFIKLPFKERLKKLNTDCSWIRYVMRAYKGHLPYDGSSATMDALRVISNSQLQTLIDTGEVEVDQCHPSPISMKQLQLDTKKSPFGPPNTSIRVSQFKRPILTLVASPLDQFPTEVGQYQLVLQYMDGPQQHRFFSMIIDPLLTEIPAQNRVSTVADRKVDIRPHGVTASVIRTTCQHALKQLEKVSGMQIVSEAFVTPPLVLLQSKGTAENVLDAICRAYRYNWRKVGDTYLVYS